MIIFRRRERSFRVQILNEAVYLLHSANAIEKIMNPTILPRALAK